MSLTPLLILAQILWASVAAAQLAAVPHAVNAAVTEAEVTAFMQAQQKDIKTLLTLRTNPKRVPLLLGAIKRETAGFWAVHLHGIYFVEDRAQAGRLPPAERPKVYAYAIAYLTTAQEIVSKALEKDPQNSSLKFNLDVLNRSLAQARSDVAQITNPQPSVSAGPASNAVPRVASSAPRENPAPALRSKACGSNLTQIDLAKRIWQADHNKPETATPTVADLAYYFPDHKLPKCLEGGTYVIGKLNQKPACSIPGHVLPPRSK